MNNKVLKRKKCTIMIENKPVNWLYRFVGET